MTDPQDVTKMGDLMNYLGNLLGRKFSASVTSVYFGDIGVYPPRVFGASRNEQKSVIVLSPAYDHLMPGERVADREIRLLGLDIICMVNITPFFEANPPEAYGERILVRQITEIADFLTQEANVTLGGRVDWSVVGDINWSWMQRKDQSIRAAAISYEARIHVLRG